ncbi:hypothetical protein ACJIZ3_011316 [Penstemon smallii]|uniref:Integrase catalytic domain-containing protein n=1 Tax=Penstemon smallii TaxID=265156 RepID=A0ABD3UIT0_9LAMI
MSLGVARYYVSFIDDYSRRCWVYPNKKKSDVFFIFKTFKARVELESEKKIKCMRTDIGGEYTSNEFDNFCQQEGIKRQFTVAYTPQQNGVAERMNITLLEHTRAMLRTAGMTKLFWAEAVKIVCYVINRSPSTVIDLKTPMELWTGKPADYSHLHTFGSHVQCPRKIEGYCLWDPTAHKVIISRDVKTVFLLGDLEEEMYMLQPEGFEEKEKENLVCRLNKSLYGLKQAPRCWYKRFDSFIMSLGYNRLSSDSCAYYKRFGDGDFIILLFYVDDMLVAGPNKDRIKELKTQLAREFEMKDLGPANKIQGMRIYRDRNNRKIWLSQQNYLKKILRCFNMQDCKPIFTPLPINFKLSSSMSPSNEAERMEMSRVPYASAVGSLMFAMVCTRPDIAQAVGAVSRYMANPGKEHWSTMKRILRYIKGTSNAALYFAGDLDKSKSTTGYVFTLAGGAVSWVSKLQSIVATSTTEAEYVAATQASKKAIWLQMLLEEIEHKQENIALFCDSQSALHLAKNPAFHSKTKHIRVQYHFVREKVEEGSVGFQKIHTEDNLADVLTEPLNRDKFIWCRSSIGLEEM